MSFEKKNACNKVLPNVGLNNLSTEKKVNGTHVSDWKKSLLYESSFSQTSFALLR